MIIISVGFEECLLVARQGLGAQDEHGIVTRAYTIIWGPIIYGLAGLSENACNVKTGMNRFFLLLRLFRPRDPRAHGRVLYLVTTREQPRSVLEINNTTCIVIAVTTPSSSSRTNSLRPATVYVCSKRVNVRRRSCRPVGGLVPVNSVS